MPAEPCYRCGKEHGNYLCLFCEACHEYFRQREQEEAANPPSGNVPGERASDE